MSVRYDKLSSKAGKKSHMKMFVDALDAWDKKHLTPPGKKVKSQAKLGEAHLLPKSTGDAKGWKDYMSKPKKYRIPKFPKY